jgi:hypothetical protein
MNTAELTFTLSLKAKIALSRRELLQIAEYIPPDPKKELTDILSYCESRIQEPSEFHQCIAAVLWLEYQYYILWKSQLMTGDQKQSDLHLPIVITTSYDRTLEKACRSLKMPYHVVFPVQVVRRGNLDVLWLFRTYTPEGDDYTKEEVKIIEEEWKDNTIPLAGPIVVKLHGSPLESLPIRLKEYEEVKHYVILTESEYLGATVQTQGSHFNYPGWLTSQLMAKGDWWFMGYPIDDWFIRMRIFQHYSYNENKSPNDMPNIRILDPSYDPIRTAIFHTLKIHRSNISLLEVQAIFKEIPEVEEILKEGVHL